MPKAKNKTNKSVVEDDKGRQWADKETGILLDVWATSSIKEMLDGPKRVAAHVMIAKKMGELGMPRTVASIQK